MIMGSWAFFSSMVICVLLFLPQTCLSSVRRIAKLSPGFRGSQMQYIDNNGLFLVSNSSDFAFGFSSNTDVTSFTIVVVHIPSSRIIWSPNRASPVTNSDNFVFGEDGNAHIETNGKAIWSTNTAGKQVSAMELRDSGNLVLVSDGGGIVWQSFSHPTNTLMPNQDFSQGMKLVSNPKNNSTFSLEVKSGDLILSAEFQNPQPYWSIRKDKRKIINRDGGDVDSAAVLGNSWRFYDRTKVFLSQFVFADGADANSTWALVLEDDGFVRFHNLESGSSAVPRIPDDGCATPHACGPYLVCHEGNTCQCPSGLARTGCGPGLAAGHPCTDGERLTLVDVGDNLSYSVLGFVTPSSKTNLEGCKSSCLRNCSCRAAFFDNGSASCYLFDEIGSFQDAKNGAGFESFVKVRADQGPKRTRKRFGGVLIAVVVTSAVVVSAAVVFGFRRHNKKDAKEDPETLEEDNFLETISGMPTRFSYADLQHATDGFSKKLGGGGFGSVYEGVLKDGTRVAVKRLEGLGQGTKEFRAEVSVIGSIHHHHLVRLRGFCAEGKQHRLLVYEYMANGSLDRWVFGRRAGDGPTLGWDARYDVAVGTAKGLAYLHEDCDVKIVHCDVKPENVLLDGGFRARVSDFGLAKLMAREQSHVFTTMRGTRGYLAPEWITSYAISEKSDVYSYGMVLLEIIGGRKNYDSAYEAAPYFPSYAFKMVEEGKAREILDEKMDVEPDDERAVVAIRVALWCIQEDVNLRPPMTKVVQMLEGLCPVPVPSLTGHTGSRLYPGVSDEGTSSGPSDCNSDAYISAVRLSGPR